MTTRRHQVGLASGRSWRREAGGRAFEAQAEELVGLVINNCLMMEPACGCSSAGSPQPGRNLFHYDLLLSLIGCHISCSSVAGYQRIAVVAFGTDVFEAEVVPCCPDRLNLGPSSDGLVWDQACLYSCCLRIIPGLMLFDCWRDQLLLVSVRWSVSLCCDSQHYLEVNRLPMRWEHWKDQEPVLEQLKETQIPRLTLRNDVQRYYDFPWLVSQLSILLWAVRSPWRANPSSSQGLQWHPPALCAGSPHRHIPSAIWPSPSQSRISFVFAWHLIPWPSFLLQQLYTWMPLCQPGLAIVAPAPSYLFQLSAHAAHSWDQRLSSRPLEPFVPAIISWALVLVSLWHSPMPTFCFPPPIACLCL